MTFTPLPASPDSAAGAAPLTARFTLDRAPFTGRAWRVTFDICPNPCCRCGGIGFECRAEDAPEPSPRCFDVDLFNRSLTPPPAAGSEGEALGRAFLAEAGDDAWTWLQRVFLAAKRRQMKTMDLDKLDVMLPVDVQADPSLLVAYRDAFPWAESFDFTHGGLPWFALDQYCVRPGCPCTEVGLACFQAATAGPPSAEPIECVTFLFHDYVSGRTRVEEAQPGSPGADVLIQSLRAAYPDFAQTLRHRHAQLQRLGRRLLSRAGARKSAGAIPLDRTTMAWLTQPPAPPIARALARPGRNAPCPCGSGRKFKKCCGAGGVPTS